MTMTDVEKTNVDRGHPFFVARMIEPTASAMEKLTPDARVLVEASLTSARRFFRSLTIPIPGSEARFGVSPVDIVFSLEFKAIFVDDVQDPAALEVIASALADGNEVCDERILLAVMGRDGEIEFQHASDLLGKYWYRYREKDMFDAAKLTQDLKDAQVRGDSGVDILCASRVPKAPGPSRRHND
jgi:hypothetical protein